MDNSRIAFVIMQIGNPELDKFYSEVYVPAIEAAKLKPKRIDNDNEGYLLKKEIIEYIETAEIIIADLTNERPNCYLEIGYAMGLDKYKNLIFTAKEDHHFESPDYIKGGPKIHFDLIGYDILFWKENDIDNFKTKLTNKINRRLSIISPVQKDNPIERLSWNQEWLETRRGYVKQKLVNLEIHRFMEVLVSPARNNLNISQTDLLNIANFSQIETFGWPIGVIMKNVPEFKPTPKADGIVSEISENPLMLSYDFSYFKKNGQIYISKSLYEEEHFKTSIIPEIRIKRTTELLLYITRFYSKCGFNPNEKIVINVNYYGLKDNDLNNLNIGLSRNQRKATESECAAEIETTIADIENKLPELVNEILKNLFVLFDFYEIDFGYLTSIVNLFVEESKNARR